MAYSEDDINRIFELMLTVIDNANGGHAAYAVQYAMQSNMAYNNYGDDGLRHQIPYVLSNLQHWRGELAKHTKQELKRFL